MIDKKIIVIAIIIVGAICFYLFSSNIFDNGARVDTIRNELEQVSQHQQAVDKRLDSVQAGISASANRISTSTERIITVEQRIEVSQGRVTESQQLIEDSQRIIATVRQRGTKGNP